VTARNKMLRSAAIVAGASYFEAAIGLLVGWVIARSMDPADFGVYAYSILLMGWLVTFLSHSVTNVLIKFSADAIGRGDRQSATDIIGFVFKVQRYAALIFLSVYAITFWWLKPIEWQGVLFAYVGITVIAIWSKATFWLVSATCDCQESFVPSSVALISVSVLNLFAVAAYAYFAGPLLGYIAIFAATGIASLLIIVILIRRKKLLRATYNPIEPELKARIIKQIASTAGLAAVSMLANRFVEANLLKAHYSSAIVGYFAIAGTLTKGAVDVLAGGLNAVLLPAMSKISGLDSKTSVVSMLHESARYYSFIGLLMAGCGLVIAPGIVFMLYGEKYAGAIPAVTWSLVIAGLTTTSSALYAFQTSTERQQDRLAVAIITVLANVAFGVMLIPTFGLVGALISLGLTRLVTLVASWLYVKRQVPEPLPLGVIARQFCAFAISTLVALGVEHLLQHRWAFVASSSVFFIGFFALLLVAKTWRKADFELVKTVTNKIGLNHRPIQNIIDVCNKRFRY
jgi:O-antigen/teichoic acid export membrane protein